MIETDILLIGGGHAQVAVLQDWISKGAPSPGAVLLTPDRFLRYSGMVPGWICGAYASDDGQIDLAALAGGAGARLVLACCKRIDPAARRVTTSTGEEIAFEIASINTGGIGRSPRGLGEDPRILDIRPIAGFVDALEKRAPDRRIAVVGGGAGGVELAFALRNRAPAEPQPDVILATGKEGLLPDMSSAVQRTASRALADQGITVICKDARIEDGELRAGEKSLEPLDLIVAALGSAAPQWPREGGLATDEAGFIAVDAHQRSISHPHVFATGDIAARQDRDVPHSGVHAVFAGSSLAANLRAATAGRAPGRTYRPRWNSLYLMSTGDGRAIASYGPLAAHGRWVARLKHWIDKRWIDKYAAQGARM